MLADAGLDETPVPVGGEYPLGVVPFVTGDTIEPDGVYPAGEEPVSVAVTGQIVVDVAIVAVTIMVLPSLTVLESEVL